MRRRARAVIAAAGGSEAPAQSAAAGGRSETPYSLTFSLTFSVQAQNLFNHTNAGTPIGNLRSTLFGQSNTLACLYGFGDRPSAGNRRFEAQVTLRF